MQKILKFRSAPEQLRVGRHKQTALCLALVACLLSGNVHAVDCGPGTSPEINSAANALEARRINSKLAELEAVKIKFDAQDQVMQASLNCMTKIKKMIDSFAVLSFPSLGKIAMQQILDYLSNMACQVVLTTLKTATDPITGQITGIQNQINGVTTSVNGVTGQVGVTGLNNGSGATVGSTIANVNSGATGAAIANTAAAVTSTATTVTNAVSSTAGTVYDRLSGN